MFDIDWTDPEPDKLFAPGAPEINTLEAATHAFLRMTVGDVVATAVEDVRTRQRRDQLSLPLYPLALWIAESWWPLLYECKRKDSGDTLSGLRGPHAMGGTVPGYVQPPMILFSAGEDAVRIELPPMHPQDKTFTTLRFLHAGRVPPKLLARAEIEHALNDLVEAVLRRLERVLKLSTTALHETWSWVQASRQDPAEAAFCRAAGGLGLDPYDEETPDLSAWAKDLPDRVFQDLCEVCALEEMPAATAWVRDRLAAPWSGTAIQIAALNGAPPENWNLTDWDRGYAAADLLRRRLSLQPDAFGPAIAALFDGETEATPADSSAVKPIQGLIQRHRDHLDLLPTAKRRESRQFQRCRALYLGWTMADGETAAVTSALTREQRSSRAFAAELLAPAAALRRRAGSLGLTPEDIDDFASEAGCSADIVVRQIENHDIPTRGVP